MALKGKPRDMNKWREVLLDPNVHFPGESSEYRRARNELSEDEAALKRLSQQVAAKRRALPAGGLIREDYVFESAADGSKVRFSELFAPSKNSMVIYNMMFPRWSEDQHRSRSPLIRLASRNPSIAARASPRARATVGSRCSFRVHCRPRLANMTPEMRSQSNARPRARPSP